MKRKEIEVIPAETKELKLGWTVHEVIGVAVVNPRATRAAVVSRNIFGDDRGRIDIRRWSIEIHGSLEAAARAFAEEVLKYKPTSLDARIVAELPDNYHAWDYERVIQVTRRNGHFTVDLTQDGVGLIDPEVWAAFKTKVEKICNTLKAFL
jgi:hypothetical protein